MKKPHLIIIAGVISPLCHAAVLFSDDFESYDADANLPGASQWNVDGRANYMVVRDEDTATPFGAPNHYLQLNDTGSGNGDFLRVLTPNLAGTHNAVTTLQFDFYEPSTGGNDSIIFGYAGIDGPRYDLNAGGGRARATLDDGTIGMVSGGHTTEYDMDTAYTIYLIFNDTATDFSYGGGSVAAFTAHLWFEELGSGVFNFAGVIDAANNPDTDGYKVGFRTFNGPQQEIWVDNFSVYEGAPAAIPEPTSALLGGLGFLMLLRRRR